MDSEFYDDIHAVRMVHLQSWLPWPIPSHTLGRLFCEAGMRTPGRLKPCLLYSCSQGLIHNDFVT